MTLKPGGPAGQVYGITNFPKYHPVPLATDSIEASDRRCLGCGKARERQPYAEEELIDAFRPWCIADGIAHEKFDAEFVDIAREFMASGNLYPKRL